VIRAASTPTIRLAGASSKLGLVDLDPPCCLSICLRPRKWRAAMLAQDMSVASHGHARAPTGPGLRCFFIESPHTRMDG
jgi:hypothetical protein